MSNQKIKILFICTGNICRSPLAHKLFEKIISEKKIEHYFEVDSCGTGGSWHEGQLSDARMRNIALKKGWELKKRARQIHPQDYHTFDYFIVMDNSHVRYLEYSIKNKDDHKKIFYLRDFDQYANGDKEVPDPYYGGQSGFENVYDMIERSCHGFINVLSEKHQIKK